MPAQQGRLRRRMNVCEPTQHAECDDPHPSSVACFQFGNKSRLQEAERLR
jgi:hypothetical protein